MNTKKTKRRIDDEMVDRLVENRPVRQVSKKKKRKKKRNLSILAVILSAVLVFVIFFVGAYIFFTATSSPEAPDTPPIAPIYKENEKGEEPLVIEPEEEEKADANEEIEGEMLLERPDAPKPSKNPTVIEDKTEEKEDNKKEETQNNNTQTQKPTTQAPTNNPKPADDVVEKNEESEAIVID